MDAQIYPALADWLNSKMGTPDAPYAKAGLPVAWTVVMPRSSMPQDIQTVIKNPAMARGVMLGVIQPGGSYVERTTRGPYTPSQSRAGAIRVGTMHLAIIARSLKQYAQDGRLLMIEDCLQELMPHFVEKHVSVEAMSLESMELGFMEPDIHVVQFEVQFKYITHSLTDAEAKLKQINLKFATIFEVLKKFEELNDSTTPNP